MLFRQYNYAFSNREPRHFPFGRNERGPRRSGRLPNGVRDIQTHNQKRNFFRIHFISSALSPSELCLTFFPSVSMNLELGMWNRCVRLLHNWRERLHLIRQRYGAYWKVLRRRFRSGYGDDDFEEKFPKTHHVRLSSSGKGKCDQHYD